MKLLTEHTQYIDCSPAKVWQETIDIESWPEWAPTIQKVKRLDNGSFGLGSSARLKQPAQPETVWKVTAFEDGKHFAWDATVRGMHMRGGHSISPSENGTISHMTIYVSGFTAKILSPFMKPLIGNAI